MKLFKENIKLANHIANKYRYASQLSYVDDEDIYQEAYLALWKACLSFDDSKGFKFSTYATPYIKGMLLTFIRQLEFVKTPRWYKSIRTHMQKHGFEYPLTEEQKKLLLMDDNIDFTEEQLNCYIEPHVISFDVPISTEESSINLKEIIPDNSIKDFIGELTDEDIEYIVSRITNIVYPNPTTSRERNKQILEEYIYSVLADDDMTYEQLAKKYGITRARVGKILFISRGRAINKREVILKLLGIEE